MPALRRSSSQLTSDIVQLAGGGPGDSADDDSADDDSADDDSADDDDEADDDSADDDDEADEEPEVRVRFTPCGRSSA